MSDGDDSTTAAEGELTCHPLSKKRKNKKGRRAIKKKCFRTNFANFTSLSHKALQHVFCTAPCYDVFAGAEHHKSYDQLGLGWQSKTCWINIVCQSSFP
jgi:hypothetical protein